MAKGSGGLLAKCFIVAMGMVLALLQSRSDSWPSSRRSVTPRLWALKNELDSQDLWNIT